MSDLTPITEDDEIEVLVESSGDSVVCHVRRVTEVEITEAERSKLLDDLLQGNHCGTRTFVVMHIKRPKSDVERGHVPPPEARAGKVGE